MLGSAVLEESEMGPLAKRGIVRDPIHGFIRINRIEYRLMQDPFLRRLHDIKQLGLNYLIFPGATHTRFSHSLGVMEIAGRIARSLAEGAKKDPICEGVFRDCDKGPESFVEVARISGLLHDIGHPPYSHQFENSLKLVAKKLILSPQALPSAGEIYKAYSGLSRLSGGKLHEGYTKGFIMNLLDHYESVLPKDYYNYLQAAAVVLGVSEDYDVLNDLYLTEKSVDVLRDIISHRIFDADRLDYLQRDAIMSGVVFGRIDIERLLVGLSIVEKDGRLKISVHSKSVSSLEHIFDARYKMYKNVYYHHKGMAINLALTKTTEHLLESWDTVTTPELREYLPSPADLYRVDRLADMIRNSPILFTDSDLSFMITRLAVLGGKEAKRWARSLLTERKLLPLSLVKRPDTYLVDIINEISDVLNDPCRGVEKINKVANMLVAGEIERSLKEKAKKRFVSALGEPHVSPDDIGIEMNVTNIYKEMRELAKEYYSIHMSLMSKVASTHLLHAHVYSDDEHIHIKLYRHREDLRKIFRDVILEYAKEILGRI